MKLLDRILNLGQALQQATQNVQAHVSAMRAEIDARAQALRHAQSAPRPPAEVAAAFNAWVDETAAYQAREYGRGLVTHRFGAPAGITGPHIGSPWTPGAELTWGFACLFLGPELKARFAELVERTPYEAGPAEAARPGVVERLTRELRELETAEEHAIDEAAAAGVIIPHRPEVVQRRQQEARRQELVATQAEAQRGREAAVDERHHRRIGHSSYLARERARQ